MGGSKSTFEGRQQVLESTGETKAALKPVTVFDHGKLDASFASALARGGTAPLWSRTSSYGTSDVSVHSRESANSACPPQGCSHKGFTAVVIVVSGAATLEVGGTSKAAAADKFGGQLVQDGESHRISQGDVFIMPPDTSDCKPARAAGGRSPACRPTGRRRR
jgi:hypothetical protein